MKKISLKSVRETLSRSEMRAISGGYGNDAYCTCGAWPSVLVNGLACSCQMYCACKCRNIYGGSPC